LKEIEQQERLRGIAPAVHAPRNAKLDPMDAKPAPRAGAEAQRPADEQAAIDRFFAEGEPAAQEEPRIVPDGPLRSAPQVPQNNEICPQCLIRKDLCGHK
jgi:hypothetical protein